MRKATWETYCNLIQVASQQHPPFFVVNAEQTGEKERAVLDALSATLRESQREERSVALLRDVGVSLDNYRQHLRRIAWWPPASRRLLAQGASFKLLEQHIKEAAEGLLDDLPELRGPVEQQRLALRAHLHRKRLPVPSSDVPGWLPPAVKKATSPRRKSGVWLYNPREIGAPGDLHPEVARTLIATCLDRSGTVVDPMAGSGTVALAAQSLGHRAWASDLTPRTSFTALLDLTREDLAHHTGEGVADLLILHPPIGSELRRNAGQNFEEWFDNILGYAEVALKQGGKLALIVSAVEAPGALERVTKVLRHRVSGDDAEPSEQHGLWGHFLAVAKDGGEAWHILVAKKG